MPRWSGPIYRVLTTLENLEISGNLLILENSENFKIYSWDISHAVFCDVISNTQHVSLRGYIFFTYVLLQCFDAVGWVAGRASGL